MWIRRGPLCRPGTLLQLRYNAVCHVRDELLSECELSCFFVFFFIPPLLHRELCGGLRLPGGERGPGNGLQLSGELARGVAAALAACGHQGSD